MKLILRLLVFLGLLAVSPPRPRRRWLPFLAVVALTLAGGPAVAADTVSTARSWLDVVLGFLGSDLGYGLLAIVGGLAVQEMRRRGVNQTILDAVENGAGLAYSRIVRSGQYVSTPGAVAGAEAEGAGYVMDRVPAALAKRGIETQDLHQMIDAKLGKLMAADPALTVQAWRVPT